MIVGGAGFFGRLLAADLLRFTGARLALGGRGEGRLRAAREELERRWSGRIEQRRVDLRDAASIDRALEGVSAAICAAGPYRAMPTLLARSCLARSIPYADFADDYDFIDAIRSAIEGAEEPAAAPPMATGFSTMPALTGALARIAAEGMERVRRIRMQIAPGNRFPRQRATVETLLASVGERFQVMREGRWREARGWSDPATFEFPPPIGPRRGYLIDMPDHRLLPPLFGGAGVEFRVGAELAPLNWNMTLLAGLRRRGLAPNLRALTPVAMAGMALLGRLGHDWGATGVEVEGSAGGRDTTRRATLIADREGHAIPVLPIAILTAKLLAGNGPPPGLVAWDRWIDRAALEAEAERRGMRLVVEEIAAG